MPRILACFEHEKLWDGVDAIRDPRWDHNPAYHDGTLTVASATINGNVELLECQHCRWAADDVTTAVLRIVGGPSLKPKRDKPATQPTPPVTNPETENRVLPHLGREGEEKRMAPKEVKTKREHRRGTAIERKVGGVPMKLIIQGNILDMEKDARDQVLGFVDSFKALPKE